MENYSQLFSPGVIEAYAGCMFSGKTQAMILRIKPLSHSYNLKFKAFKPATDNRYDLSKIIARFGEQTLEISGQPIDPNNVFSIKNYLDGEQIVAIDEAQFFKDDLVDLILELQKNGKHIILTTLDLDFRGEPFGIAPKLLSYATIVHKMYGLCVNCKKNNKNSRATRTQRLVNGIPAHYDDPIVLIQKLGKNVKETYECRCVNCHEVKKD